MYNVGNDLSSAKCETRLCLIYVFVLNLETTNPHSLVTDYCCKSIWSCNHVIGNICMIDVRVDFKKFHYPINK